MADKTKENQMAWLHAAQVVADCLALFPHLYTADGIKRRQAFIDKVRATNGVGMDEVYKWDDVKQLLAF